MGRGGATLPPTVMEKILEGSLTHFEVPDLLTFLNLGRRTGVLVLERTDRESKLFFREGRPLYATSTADELRFGTLLVKFKKLDPDALDRVLHATRPMGRIGQTLLQANLLSEEELASFLKVQVSEVIFNTFEWHQGVFAFFDKVDPPVTAVTLDIDLHNLIMEGVRRIDERGRLAEAIPDRSVVVEAVANPERVKQSVTLTPDEWRVFFLVDGRRSVSEICRTVGNPDELATLQIVHNLVQAKFVRLAPALVPGEEELPATSFGGKSVATMLLDPKGVAQAASPKVEYSPASPVRRDEGDDTKEIVNPKAQPYLADADNAAGKVTMSRLVLVKDGVETSFPLVRDSYTLGRHRNNDIVVSDPKASSFHARIDRSPEGFVIVDLKSRNGCWLNGTRVETARLKTGDEVRVGMARLLYRVDYQSSA
jgi:Domain of unknown function (DUF4388)/FHA domain